MNELQPYDNGYGGSSYGSGYGNPGVPAQTGPQAYGGYESVAPPTIDIASGGPKRDYAGILEYWQIVRRHKGWVVLATIVGGLVGGLSTLPSPRVYQARTTMEIQGMNSDFLNMRGVNPVSDGVSAGADPDVQTQVRILQSATLIGKVREELDTAPHPTDLQPPDRLGRWRKTLKINPPTADQLWASALGSAANGVRVRAAGTTRIVEVTCDSTSQQLAADFCNTLTKLYIEENLETRWKSTEYTGQWLAKQLDDLKIKIEKSEEELQSYASKTGLVIAGEKNDVQETRLADLQKDLSVAQSDRIAKQSRYEMAVASTPDALPEILDDASLKASQSELAQLKAKLAQTRVGYTSNYTEVRRIEAQITVVEQSIKSTSANIVTRIRNDYEAAKRREDLLAAEFSNQGRLVTGKAEELAHYGLLKREVEASRLLYDNLQQKLKEASIASAMRASNIRVVDPATKPNIPYKPDVRSQAMVGLVGGFVLGVGLVVLRERADRTIQDPGDSSYYLGLPELGVVPINASMLAKPGLGTASSASTPLELTAHHQKTSVLAEAYRATLTSILFSARNGIRPRVIVLTSASPKEGKTTTACNLAISLADISKRVLVVDGDLRRPRLHTVFSASNERGFSDLLAERHPLSPATIEEACQKTEVPGLFVLTSGGARFQASSLLHSQRLPEFINLVREQFDGVVIDTPPMANIADARVLGRYADVLTLVIRSGGTTRDAALLARSRFAEDGLPILGTILNHWNPATPGYGYYHYYSGYQHYFGDKSKSDGENEASALSTMRES
ncbi:MAG: polysaccharide biosynthesis tyrosine autokinase [Vicinamibacterales bacterium]